jgi:hypothetical protein
MLSSTKQWIVRTIVRPGVRTLSGVTAWGLSRYVPGDEAYGIFERRGYHLLRKNFYLPIPEREDLGPEFYRAESELVGIDLNETEALELLRTVFARHAPEFRDRFPFDKPDGSDSYYLLNSNFMGVDAPAYYSLILHQRPARIIEIGSGFSTLVAAAAVEKLSDEGHATELVAVDPYPVPFLKEGFPGLSGFVEKKVQDAGLDLFTSLAAGDILFIDSTHALREGGDVQFEYCELLPRLAPGVLVHIHDISLPRPYPRVYAERFHYYWNEQYLLQAFLAYNSRFEVVWPGNYMMLRHPEEVFEVFPEMHTVRASFPEAEPSSFWMRVTSVNEDK